MKTGKPNITTEQLTKLANDICEATAWNAEITESGECDVKIASFADEDEALEFLALGQVSTKIEVPEFIIQTRRDGRMNLILFSEAC